MPAAPAQLDPGKPNEHPLMPALRWAHEGLTNIEKIQDYSATVVKRERLSGKIGEYQYMFVKVRHKPFSVYMYFSRPASRKGAGSDLRRGRKQRQHVGARHGREGDDVRYPQSAPHRFSDRHAWAALSAHRIGHPEYGAPPGRSGRKRRELRRSAK